MTTSQQPAPCTLRRSDKKPGHEHWLKYGSIAQEESLKQTSFTYHGTCHCEAITYEFQTSSRVDENTTFYSCICNVCFKRGYIFYVVHMKQFKYFSRSAMDLGTFATDTGIMVCCGANFQVLFYIAFVAIVGFRCGWSVMECWETTSFRRSLGKLLVLREG